MKYIDFMGELVVGVTNEYLRDITRTNIKSIHECEHSDLLDRIRDYFKQFDGEHFVEIERNNTIINRVLNVWFVSMRSPLKYLCMSDIARNNVICFDVLVNNEKMGFRNLSNLVEMGISDYSIYLGHGGENGKKRNKVRFQYIYVREQKANEMGLL
jgi:hypothetical protein